MRLHFCDCLQQTNTNLTIDRGAAFWMLALKTHCMLSNFGMLLFFHLMTFFKIICCFFLKKNPLRNAVRLTNRLDSDQAQHFVGPDFGPNCVQKLSTDDTSRQSVKYKMSQNAF